MILLWGKTFFNGLLKRALRALVKGQSKCHSRNRLPKMINGCLGGAHSNGVFSLLQQDNCKNSFYLQNLKKKKKNTRRKKERAF